MQLFNNRPYMRWSKVDNDVIHHPGLSDGAKVLYVSLCSIKQAAIFSEQKMYEKMGISRGTYYKRKKELMALGLVHMVQEGPRTYKMYLGHTRMRGEEVKESLCIGLGGEEDKKDPG